MLVRLLFIGLTTILLSSACMGDTLSKEVQEAIESGNTHFDKGDLDLAIADFDRAIEQDPDFAEAYINRGTAYGIKGDLNRAIAEFDLAIELDPAYAAAYYNRGIAYGDKGDLDLAIADFRYVLRISNDPNYRQFAEEQLELLGATP
jgi:tetratricopeptide (TPR) repeat protein